VVDQNAPHHAGGNRQEMRAVLPRDIFGIDEPEIRFVDQRRRLKAVPDALSGHAPSGDLVKLALYERNQSVEGGLVALTPSEQQSGGLGRMVGNVAILSLFRGMHRLAAPSRCTSRRVCHAFYP